MSNKSKVKDENLEREVQNFYVEAIKEFFLNYL